MSHDEKILQLIHITQTFTCIELITSIQEQWEGLVLGENQSTLQWTQVSDLVKLSPLYTQFV